MRQIPEKNKKYLKLLKKMKIKGKENGLSFVHIRNSKATAKIKNKIKIRKPANF